MKFWERKREVTEAGRGLARAALDGASRLETAGEALQELRADGVADRIGIWLACDVEAACGPRPEADAPTSEPDAPGGTNPVVRIPDTAWRGVVWDRESESIPPEWQQLSGEAPPLPQDVVLGGRTVEQELTDGQPQILLGILIELRKVLWVPITVGGRLRGVILCGARDAHVILARAHALRVAAELALHLAWEQERAIARERHADLLLARRVYAELEHGGNAELALMGLADSVVATDEEGIGAAFASIGILAGEKADDSEAHADVEFRWQGGDADWLRMVPSEIVSETWREALRQRRTTGSVPPAVRIHMTVTRIVAVPITGEGELTGVLLVGLLPRATSLAALERLEYRAELAGIAMARWSRERAATRATRRQQAALAGSRECFLLLDERGRLAEFSPRAAELLLDGPTETREEAGTGTVRAPRHTTNHAGSKGRSMVAHATGGALRPAGIAGPLAGMTMQSLFREEDRLAVEGWRQRETETLAESWNAGEDALDAKLRNGIRVRLRRSLPSGVQGRTVVTVTKLEGLESPAVVVNDERVLEGVIEWLEEGVVLFDAQENVRAHNTRFEQLAGLGPLESAKGATLRGLIERMEVQAADPVSFAERWRELAGSIEGGVRDELRMMRPAPRLLERTARPVFDAVGRRVGRVEVYRDLTAQRMFQSQLLQTEKLAALGQMVSGVAHELSNPLTSILGYAQRLLLRPDGGGKLPEVRQIFQEAERAAGILRQLLFSAREAPPERRRVALNQVVLRSMELQRFSMATEKVSMELDLDPGLPVVLGDAAQLQQVLMNLVGNARQAIEQKGGGGRVRVRTKQVAERRVQLEIEDDGPGVPQSIMARIFDPFFTTKAEGVGTGLGLSIVLSIVREHGGRVNVKNGPEGGAIFSVELPVAEGVSVAPPWPAGSFERDLHLGAAVDEAAPMAVNAALARRVVESQAYAIPRRAVQNRAIHGRVLVVEDEPTVARLIADVLQDEGLLVEVLLDGREGLKRAAERQFDLVICDMRMPGLDGQQFYGQLVKAGNVLRYSFLFVTGDVIAPATQAFLEQNRLPHLAKPFRVEELTARVREVLESKNVPALQSTASAKSHKWKNAAGK